MSNQSFDLSIEKNGEDLLSGQSYRDENDANGIDDLDSSYQIDQDRRSSRRVNPDENENVAKDFQISTVLPLLDRAPSSSLLEAFHPNEDLHVNTNDEHHRNQVVEQRAIDHMVDVLFRYPAEIRRTKENVVRQQSGQCHERNDDPLKSNHRPMTFEGQNPGNASVEYRKYQSGNGLNEIGVKNSRDGHVGQIGSDSTRTIGDLPLENDQEEVVRALHDVVEDRRDARIANQEMPKGVQAFCHVDQCENSTGDRYRCQRADHGYGNDERISS